MARMMLYLDKSKQSADNRTMTFPIYKLDFDKLKTMTTITYGDTNERPYMEQNGGYLQEVTSAPREACYYTRISASSGSLYQCLSTNIPKQAWQEGSINRYRISPMIQDEYNIYAINPEYFNFERVEGENPPDDWEDNFWYWKETIQSFTYQSNSYQYYAYDYHLPTQSGGYSQNETWIRDIDHKLGAKFYTDSGYSFGWFWNPYTAGARSKFGNDMSSMQFFGWRKPETSSTTNEGIRVQTDKPYIDPQWVSSRYIKGITPFSRTTSSEKYKLLTGDDTNLYNYVAFFVSFYIDNIPFYGIAVTHTDGYGENATPQSIEIVAFTPDFWGGSIISGGGDDGEWGQDSTTGGGGGTFDFDTTYNRDPDLPYIIRTAMNVVLGDLLGLNYSLWKLSGTDFNKIMGVLYSQTFAKLYENSVVNPMSGVINLALMPENLIGDTSGRGKMTISGYNVSDAISGTPEFNTIHPTGYLGFDPIAIDNVFDAFPDFSPYTQAMLHLPYIGDIEIDINYIAHGSMKVMYLCDNYSGNVYAWVWCRDRDGHTTFKYSATGNCAYNIPILSTFFDGSSVGKLRDSLAYTASNMFISQTPYFGDLLGSKANAAKGMFSAASDVMGVLTAPRGTIVRGAFGGNAALLSDTLCYLEITRPEWIQPKNYAELNGITSELSGTLFDDMSDNHTTYDGYTLVSEIHLENVDCTENEKRMIADALMRGVHIHAERY